VLKTFLIVGSIIGVAGCTARADSPSQPIQRYQIVTSNPGNAWKLDTQTGVVELCVATYPTGPTCRPVVDQGIKDPLGIR
jgi:hypothetical protein